MFYNKYRGDVLGNTGAASRPAAGGSAGAAAGEFYYVHCLSKYLIDRIHGVALNQLGDSQLDVIKSFNTTSHGDSSKSPRRSGSPVNKVDTRHKRTWKNPAVETKVPLSKSISYQLKKARALANKSREQAAAKAGREMMSMNGSLEDEMAYLSKVNRSLQQLHGANRGVSRQKAQMLAGDDALSPLQKLEVVKLEIQRLLSHSLDSWEQQEQERRQREQQAGASPSKTGSKRKAAPKSFPPSMAVLTDYEALNEFCIVQCALCKLQFGDWCLESAAAEYDLAVSYLLLSQPVMARDHAQAARKTAHSVLEKDPLLEIKADLAEACAVILIGHGVGSTVSTDGGGTTVIAPDSNSGAKAVTLACRSTDAFAKHLSLAPQDASMFPFHYVKCAALFLQGSSHQRALDAMDDALASCGDRNAGPGAARDETKEGEEVPSYPPPSSGWSDILHVHILKMSVHFDLLARVTTELLALPVQSSKEKLLAQLAEVSTQDQLTQISTQLKGDLDTLNEKKKSLQLTMVRQGQQIQELLKAGLAALDVGSGCAVGDMICPAQVMQLGQLLHSCCRAGWIGQQHEFAVQAAEVATSLLVSALGESDMMTLQVAVDEALLTAGSSIVPTTTFLSNWQQTCRCLDPTTASSTSTTSSGMDISAADICDPLQQVVSAADNSSKKKVKKTKEPKARRGRNRRDSTASTRSSRSSSRASNSSYSNSYTQSDSSSSSDSDNEENEDSAVAQRARGRGKLEEVLPKVSQTFGSTSGVAHTISVDLEKAYARSGDSHKESIHTALLCDVYATLLGPTHPRTCQKLEEFEHKQKKVHAPLFSPSWGVLKLLDKVSLSTATEGAQIYFTTSGETPCEDQGVHQSMCYMGPIVLDTLGRVTIKAFAVYDGKQSGVVEAQYSVMKK